MLRVDAGYLESAMRSCRWKFLAGALTLAPGCGVFTGLGDLSFSDRVASGGELGGAGDGGQGGRNDGPPLPGGGPEGGHSTLGGGGHSVETAGGGSFATGAAGAGGGGGLSDVETLSTASSLVGAMVAVWSLDELNGFRKISGGSCADASCDLQPVGIVDGDPENRMEGTASASIHSNEAMLECGASSAHPCPELRPVAGQSVTAGCWAFHTAATYGPLMNAFAADNGGWYLASAQNGAHDGLDFGVGSSGPTAVAASTASGALPLNTWTHVVGRFDNVAERTSAIFVNGKPGGGAASPLSDFGESAPSSFHMSEATGGAYFYNWEGSLDECFVSNHVLTDGQICKICSCGVDGSLCKCDPESPDEYKVTGRNLDNCGACALSEPCGI